MERKIGNQLALFTALLLVVWLLLLVVQIHMAHRVFSNQKELFEVELSAVFEDALAPLDTVDYDAIDSLIGLSLKSHSISYPYDLGIYSDDEEEFLFLTEDADTENLIENGFQYKLLRVTDEEAQLDTILIFFPKLSTRFRHEMIRGYLLIAVLFVLLLVCFAQSLYLRHKQHKINVFKEKMGRFIVHELKTPLTTINLSTQLLRDKSVVLDEATKDSYLNMIADETKTLEVLADEVLTVFRSMDMPKVENVKVSVHPLLEAVCKMHKQKLDDCQAELCLDFQAECDTVMGNYTHLFNAFSNLIDNAIKYRKDNLRLEITTRNQDNRLVVKVIDNGIGIRKENLPLIFDAFARFNTDDAHYVKGYGLGLNYVKHIIDYHKGTVSVESQLPEGTIFTVTLPLVI